MILGSLWKEKKHFW